MEESRLSRYAELRREHPDLFVNPPDAAVEILTQPADVAEAEAAAAGRLAQHGRPTDWARTGVVYEDEYGFLLRDPVRFPGGRLGTYIREFNAGNAPGVVVMPALRGDLLLVRHFRHATRTWQLEFPRGYGDPGAKPEDDARRELQEEIGARPTRVVDLGVVYPNTGVSGTPVLLYFAEIDAVGELEREEGIAEVTAVSPDHLAALIRDGEITDGFTINAYARALLRGLIAPPVAG